MKKAAIITCAVALFFTASLKAQTDTVPKQPTTPETPVTEKPASSDKWNNFDPAKYQLLPMPSPLTTEKIFPAMGSYTVTNKEGASSNLTVTLDESNKGIVWIDGLPEGRIKAYLRKSPGIYKIPEQKIGEDKDAKTVAEGVMIYDKDANVLNVCVGCKYNAEDPALIFAPEPVVTEEQPVDEKATKAKKSAKKTAKAKEPVVKPVFYTGSKIMPEEKTTTVTETVQPDM